MTKGSKIGTGFIVGALFTLAPVFGIIATDVFADPAFRSLGPTGISDLAVSRMLHALVLATGAGIVVCPIGIVILVFTTVALVKSRRAQSSAHVTPTI